jgi:hypothetical protein
MVNEWLLQHRVDANLMLSSNSLSALCGLTLAARFTTGRVNGDSRPFLPTEPIYEKAAPLVGFAGALMVAQPGGAASAMALLAFVAALLGATRDLCPASAPMGRPRLVEERRISGSSQPPRACR